MLRDVLDRLYDVIVFSVSIPGYDLASVRRCFKVADDTIDDVLEIHVRVSGCLFLFVEPVVVLVVALAISFRSPLGECSAAHLIYTDRIFHSVPHDASALWSDINVFIQSQSTRAKHSVTLGSWSFGDGCK